MLRQIFVHESVTALIYFNIMNLNVYLNKIDFINYSNSNVNRAKFTVRAFINQ